MKNMLPGISLQQLAQDVWLIEELRKASEPGLTLQELQEEWSRRPSGNKPLTRSTLYRHRENIRKLFAIHIDSPDKKHYLITNPDQLSLDSLANDLLASMQEYLFLDEYRDLGCRIQPQEILSGLEYLHPIGDALRNRNKLHIRYQKFIDERPYEAIVHPYCLKAHLNRWYILAHKEGSECPAQCFALDRMQNLRLLDEHFSPDPTIDPEDVFRDYFGVWINDDRYPVTDIVIAATPHAANYLRTLPLHHSQKTTGKKTADGKILFSFHIAPTPDFMGELHRWGEEIEILKK